MNPCCCLKLKTGAIIIAVLEIIGASIGLIVSGFAFTALWMTEHLNMTELNITLEGSKVQEFFNDGTKGHDSDQHEMFQLLYILMAVIMVLSIIQLIFACMLIAGVQKKSLTLMKAWIIFKCCELAVSLGLYAVSLFTPTGGIQPKYYDIVTLVIGLYFIWVVVALFREMKQSQANRNPKPLYKI